MLNQWTDIRTPGMASDSSHITAPSALQLGSAFVELLQPAERRDD